MALRKRRLLEALVAAYDRQQRPVRVADLAAEVGATPSAVRACLAAFEACELIVLEDRGARPTVTGRELLELEVGDAALLVVDPEGETRERLED